MSAEISGEGGTLLIEVTNRMIDGANDRKVERTYFTFLRARAKVLGKEEAVNLRSARLGTGRVVRRRI